MADYESFARNEPKKLARAIEAGIPPALRGMLWQLMWVFGHYIYNNAHTTSPGRLQRIRN